MSGIYTILLMIFLHIVDDYYLQKGWMSEAKQKKYWEDNAPDKMYKFDYIWVLLMHSFSWSFMIMLPIAFVEQFNIGGKFLTMFILNLLLHASVDNHKANERRINLWQDQLIHIVQIILTYFFIIIWR